jgi:predicted nucleic acid-binding protein
MPVDPTRFHPLNVTDTCSVWNVLSSRLLYARAVLSKCFFSCTGFVRYECLFKKRVSLSLEDQELQSRLRKEMVNGQFRCFGADLEDLQDVEILQNRKRLSLGELSSIAFAKKTTQAFLTDDQKARRLAEAVLGTDYVQTIPHLFGWLLFIGSLQDSDKDQVLREHAAMKRPLGRFFEEMYLWALEQRLKSSSFGKPPQVTF